MNLALSPRDPRVAAALVLMTVLTFSPAINNEFLKWDDDGEIIDNPYVQSLSVDNIRAMFATTYLDIYHPLTTLSWATEYRLVKFDPRIFHYDNIVIHSANVLLVLWLLYLLGGNAQASVVAAALFAVHPLRVESVAWATERKDLLYAFFFLASSICYVCYLRSAHPLRWYACALLCFVLSCFAKGQAVSLPLVLILIDFLRGRRRDRWLLADKIPFFATAAAFGTVAVFAQRSSGWIVNAVGFSIARKLLNASYAIGLYVQKLLFPVHLSAIYPYPERVAWSVVLVPVLLVLVVWYTTRHTRKIAFGLGFFLATIVFVLPLLGVGKFIAADRFTYVPLIGVFYLAGEGFSRMVTANTRWVSRGCLAGLLCVLTLCAVLSYQRCKVWRSSSVLMSDVIEQFPTEPNAYFVRALAGSDPHQVINDSTQAIIYSSGELRGHVYNTRGLAYWQMRDGEKAIADYDEGIALAPGYGPLYYNRSIYYFYGRKQYRKAWDDLNRARGLGLKVDLNYWRDVENAVSNGL